MKNFKIIEEKDNKLFNRKEIRASIEADITPNNTDIEKIISKKFSIQPENIKIKKIKGSFGSNNFIISANIYNSKKDKESIEGKSKGEKIAESHKDSDKGEVKKKTNVESSAQEDKSLTE